jgi:carboxyl-terminal processing protease
MYIPRNTRLLALAWLLTVGSGAAAATEGEEPAGRLPLDELRTFADVFNQIRVGYVEEIDDSELLEYAIRGMLNGLDPHSVYLTRDAFEDLQTSTNGEFSGLGLEVGMDNGFLKVISPIDGSPAAEAGMQSGDVILKIDNVVIKGMPINEAVEKMRGPKGSEIVLTIGRPGTAQPFDLTLTRDVIKVASVRERWLEPGFAYLRISQFQKNTGDDVRAAIERLIDEEDHERPGRSTCATTPAVCSAPASTSQGCSSKAARWCTPRAVSANAGRTYAATSEDMTGGVPIVILINGGSASASEIVAGALQDHGRAVVMGTPSFGKGSVQTVLPISEERAVKLTTALYFTPNGRSIQAEGIQPDMRVERARVETFDESGRLSERDLARHLDSDRAQAAVNAEASRGLISSDLQLYEALTVLKGIHILAPKTAPIATGQQTAAADPD